MNEKLLKELNRANAKRDRLFKKYQTACSEYHWTVPDAGQKWKNALAARDGFNASCKEADAALERFRKYHRL